MPKRASVINNPVLQLERHFAHDIPKQVSLVSMEKFTITSLVNDYRGNSALSGPYNETHLQETLREGERNTGSNHEFNL